MKRVENEKPLLILHQLRISDNGVLMMTIPRQQCILRTQHADRFDYWLIFVVVACILIELIFG